MILELKLIADVGLVGFPNVGKSTILSMVTAATPKIADYHFTTLEPSLGVVNTKHNGSFVMADIPGIIEGASEGVGLGLQFLRHIERTRLLLHVVDVSGSEGRDPVDDFNKINEELKKYSEKLASRKQIIVANKSDILQSEENFENLKKIADEKGFEIFKISAATKQGIEELMEHVAEVIKTLPKEELFKAADRVVYELKDEAGYVVTKEGEDFIVEGPVIDRILGRVNMADNESMYYFQKCLRENGIEDELRRKGVKAGDTIKFGNWDFEWYE